LEREERQLAAYEQLAREVEKLVDLVQESQQNQYEFMQEACRLLQEQHRDVHLLVSRAGEQEQLQAMLDEVLKQLNAQFQGQMIHDQTSGSKAAESMQPVMEQPGVMQPGMAMEKPGLATEMQTGQQEMAERPDGMEQSGAIPIPLTKEKGMSSPMFANQEAVPVVKPVTQPAKSSRIRFFHASPDAPGVDIYVDGKKVAEGVDYQGVSDYIAITPGRHRVQAFPYGKQVGAVIDTTFNAKPHQSYTVAAAGFLRDIRPIFVEDEPKKTKPGFARLKVVHLMPEAPAVDVTLPSGKILIGHLTYKEKSNYLQVTPGTRDLQLRVAGRKDIVLSVPKIRFDPNVTYTLYVIGSTSAGQKLSSELLPEA
jgi:hypothetical protein